jgi:hypothetical protein
MPTIKKINGRMVVWSVFAQCYLPVIMVSDADISALPGIERADVIAARTTARLECE